MKKMRILLSVLICLSLTFSMAVNAQADEKVSISQTLTQLPNNRWRTVRVKEYYDEELGCVVTETTEVITNNRLKSKSGSGTYKNTKEFTWDNNTSKSSYYAQGYFKWGNGEVSVSSPTGNINNLPANATIEDSNISSGTGKYGFVFNKYAYVTYSCTVKTVVGIKHDLSVSIRISENGNLI